MSAEPSAEQSGRFVIGLLLGLVGTCVVGSLVGIPAAYAIAKASKNSEPNRGWALVPKVVYAVDVPAGTVVTFDMISQRSVPRQFADESIVNPDAASYIVNVPIRASVRAGDPVRWSHGLPPAGIECFRDAGQ